MKNWAWAILLLPCSLQLQASAILVENPFAPYPPGCITLPEFQTALYGSNRAKVYEGRLNLALSSDPEQLRPANVAIYRVACAEPDRSVILMDISVPDGEVPFSMYQVPFVSVSLQNPDREISLQPLREPNVWLVNSEFWYSPEYVGNREGPQIIGHDEHWTFVLRHLGKEISTAEYNGDLTLLIRTVADRDDILTTSVDVPAASEILTPNPNIPLNGRLSGNWVMEGIPDQGLLISISEQVPSPGEAVPDVLAESPLLLFLSWYTYDADGELLWLTGAADFALGATEVTVPIELVTNGQFLGSKLANREVVGSATLSARSCNDLEIQYDLNDFGLGSGTQSLQRIFSLETAGYACRDLDARILENGK